MKNLFKPIVILDLFNRGRFFKYELIYGLVLIFSWVFTSTISAQNLNIMPNGQKHTFQLYDLPNTNGGLLHYYEFGDGTYLKHGLDNFDMALYNPISTATKVIYKTYKTYDGSGPPPLMSQNHIYGTSANRTIANTIGRTEMDDPIFKIDISSPGVEIIPNEENVIILGIKKPGITSNWNGDVYLFFNRSINLEKNRSFNNFFRTYFKDGKKYRTSVNITSFTEGSTANSNDNNIDKSYKNFVKFSFNNITDSDQKNIFVNLKTLGIASQVNNQIPIKGLLIAGGTNEIRTLNLDVRYSRDPNKITVKPACTSCKSLNNKRLNYTVEFQNLGNGTTSKIIANVKTPLGVDLATINNVYVKTSNFQNVSYSRCSGSSTLNCWKYEVVNTNELRFYFYDAQLLGSSDPAVDNINRTTGSFTYSLRLNNNINCNETLNSQAFIVFDNNPAIKTNVAKTTFPKAFSFKSKAFKIGLDYELAESKSGGFLGIVMKPKQNCRTSWYNQFELMAGYLKYNCNSTDYETCSLYSEATDSINAKIYELNNHNINFAIVPLHLRRDLANNFDFGFGVEFRAIIKTGDFFSSDRTAPYSATEYNFDSSLFADLNYNFGVVGLGLRYLYGFELILLDSQFSNNFTNINRGQVYIQFML